MNGNMLTFDPLGKELAFLALLAIFCFIIAHFASKRHWISVPKTPSRNPVKIYHVVLGFLLFFLPISLIAIILIPISHKLLIPYELSPVAKYAIANFIIVSAIAICIIFYTLITGKKVRNTIWNNQESSSTGKMLTDIGWGALCFFITFPITIFINQIINLILFKVFHITELPQQDVVNFMKRIVAQPKLIWIAISLVVFLIPLVEEFLFRGILQNWLKNHLRPIYAIFVTSTIFSLVHFSKSQGYGNIPLLGTIFALSMIIGILYEKRGSLLASISLHSTFNSMALIQIVFFDSL